MITPIDRETRKTLLHLAETSSEHRVAARIVLGLTAGQSEEALAKAARVSLVQARHWIDRYRQEGLSIFGDALTSEPAVPLAVAKEAPPEFDTAEESGGPYADAETFTEPRRPPRPLTPRRPTRSRSTKQSTAREPERRRRESQRRHARPRSEAESVPTSVDDAVLEGLSDLLDDEEEDLVARVPVRQVIAQLPVVEEVDVAEPGPLPTVEETLPITGYPDPSTTISVSALAAAFNVDMAHARHISKQTRELFDITTSVHRLPNHYRDLLHAAAMLHNIAFEKDAANHHVRGRDLILQYYLKDISVQERQMIATMTALHRLDTLPQHEATFVNLPESLRHATETLAALLRMGVGLDYSHTQSSEIVEWRSAPGELRIVIRGEEATSKDIPRAQQKSSLWNRLYSTAQIRFVAETQLQTAERLADVMPRRAQLEPDDINVVVSNKLRWHYGERLNYLAERIRHADSGLLVPLWREFLRLTGVWQWLLAGTKPRQVSTEDTQWVAGLIQETLYAAAAADRINGLFNETDLDHDDPIAVRNLKDLCSYYEQSAAQAFEQLRECLASRRFTRWLKSTQTELKGREQSLPFSTTIAARAWGYLAELRETTNQVNRVGLNADLESLLTVETARRFEHHLRILSDFIVYTAGLLGAEHRQALEVLEPLLDYVQAWQRMETVAQMAAHDKDRADMEAFSPFVREAFALLMRQRADEMRWDLVEMWEPLNTPMFRRTLALAVAKP